MTSASGTAPTIFAAASSPFSRLRTASTTVAPWAASTRGGLVAEPGVRAGDDGDAAASDRARRRRSTLSWRSCARRYSGVMFTLVDPANPPSRKAPLVWALGAAIPWTLLSSLSWCGSPLDGRLGWLHATAAAARPCSAWRCSCSWCRCGGTACTGGTSGSQAVYTRTGWLVQERRIAPISRVQTVDTHRGPLDRLFGLGQRHRDDGVVGGRGADRRAGLRRRRPTRRATHRRRRDRRAGRDVTPSSRRVAQAQPTHAAGAPDPRGAAPASAADRFGGARVVDRQRRCGRSRSLAFLVAFGVATVVHHYLSHRRRADPACATGVLQRKVLSLPRNRIRSVSTDARLLHRLLGLTVVKLSTGQEAKGDAEFALDAVRSEEVPGLRAMLLDESPSATTEQRTPERVLARWQPSWLRYSPLSFTGLAMIVAAVGLVYQTGAVARLENSELARQGLDAAAAARSLGQRRGDCPGGAALLGVAVGTALTGHVRQSGVVPTRRGWERRLASAARAAQAAGVHLRHGAGCAAAPFGSRCSSVRSVAPDWMR